MHQIQQTRGRESVLAPAAVLLLAILLLAGGAQALIIPMDGAALAKGADEVVRGRIANVSSAWNADHTAIATTATVRVTGRAKGSGPDTLALTVPGGTVAGVTLWVEDQPAFVEGGEAFVFVKHGPQGNRVYGGAQGVVPVEKGRVRGAGREKGGGVPVAAYAQYLAALADGRPVAEPAAEPAPRAAAGAAPVITGVSPPSAAAGTGTAITITGTGFGTRSSRESLADVGFTYRYTGSSLVPIWASGYPDVERNPDEIVSWSDTRIVVRVPAGITPDGYGGAASSGFLWVLTEENAASAGRPFTVTFGYGGAKWDGPCLFQVNPAGMSPDLEAAITNASATWNAALPAAASRFAYAGTTSETTELFEQDGVNLVSFGSESDFDLFGSTALAQASTWREDGRIYEVDVKFNPGYDWTAGTAVGDTWNMETVTLHELGHWLRLCDLYGWVPGYPSDTGETMFGYCGDIIGNRNRRALGADDIAGIRWIYAGGAPPLTPVPAGPQPYPATHAVPGTVEAEDYDAGGEGVAYHDAEPANLGRAYRPGEGVDVEISGGVTDVGWVRSGEWLAYTVNATVPQSVVLRVRAANPDAGKLAGLSVGGVPAPALYVPSTGSFEAWGTAVSEPFWLPAGATTLRLSFDGIDRVNLDRLEIAAAGLSDPGIAKPTPPPTPTPTPEPALLIDAPGSYELDRDLASTWAGVVIASSDVVLDGMGHSVGGVGDVPVYVAGAGAGVAARGDWGAPLSNVTVRNLTVRNWWHGIEIADVENATVEGVVAEGNLAGCRLVVAEHAVVRDSAFRDNPGVGLDLDWRTGALVENCLVARNNVGVMGEGAGTQDRPLVLSGCEVVENRGSGVVLFGGGYLGSVRNCTIARNEGDGIRLDFTDVDFDEFYPGGGSIAGNRVEENGGAGVSLVEWPGCAVSGNRIDGNAVGVATGGNAAPRVWDNLLNNTVNLAVAEFGTVPVLNATPAPGPNVAGGPSLGGNFWASLDGAGFSETHADADRDGFCDEPFEALPGAVDYLPLAPGPVTAVPPGTASPTDPDGDGVYDDVNGNGRPDFADVVLYFNQMAWIAANEPVAAFDCNANGRVDFADVVWLFNRL